MAEVELLDPLSPTIFRRRDSRRFVLVLERIQAAALGVKDGDIRYGCLVRVQDHG